jgi:hypothetical protein
MVLSPEETERNRADQEARARLEAEKRADKENKRADDEARSRMEAEAKVQELMNRLKEAGL